MDFIILISTLCVPAGVLSSIESGAISKHILPKYAHKSQYIGTLSWAVKLKLSDQNMKYNAESYADQVAEELGLQNIGLEERTADIYLFIHHSHGKHWKQIEAVHRSLKNPDILKVKKKLEDSGENFVSETIDLILQQLELHPAVEWYSHQVVRRRRKRSISFDDPWYYKQWHLVMWL